MGKVSLQYANVSGSRGPENSSFVMYSPFVCCNTKSQEVVADRQEREIAVPERFHGQLQPSDC